jgi:hypothetical protein
MVYSKQTVKCRYLIFWPGCLKKVYCHIEKLEGDSRLSSLVSAQLTQSVMLCDRNLSAQ